MRNMTRLWIVPTLLLLTGCGSTRTIDDPVDRITALVVAGRYEDAISEFVQLPAGIENISYVRAANATSLACATLASLQDDPGRRKAFFDEATRLLPDITQGKYHIPSSSSLRAEMETAQAIVRMTIKHLKTRTADKAP